MVFGYRDGLISGGAQPALEKLANEFVGFDDDDTNTRAHGNSLVHTDPSAQAAVPILQSHSTRVGIRDCFTRPLQYDKRHMCPRGMTNLGRTDRRMSRH